MSEISYFQKYSQKENHITNTVLFMLRTLYRKHPRKLQTVLQNLFSENNENIFYLTIGPKFNQQISMEASVPDGQIFQEEFNIIIEVKPDKNWNEPQLIRHIESAAGASRKNTVLLLLSTDKSPQFSEKLTSKAKDEGVTLLSTSFDSLIEAIAQDEVIAEHETDLIEISNDFKDVLSAAKLLENPYLMFAFGCSRTLTWNLNHKIYYDKLSRPTKSNVLTGFYANKKIHALGKASATLTGSLKNGFKVEGRHKSKNKAELESILKLAIEKSDLSKNHEDLRWYIYDDLHPTDFEKATPYGYFQGVWFNLKNYSNVDPTNLKLLAEKLKNKKFGNDRGF